MPRLYVMKGVELRQNMGFGVPFRRLFPNPSRRKPLRTPLAVKPSPQ